MSTDELESKIIQKFRDARLTLGWSQAEVARRLNERGVNLHKSAIAKIETGARSLDLETTMRLCDVLGVKWEDLYQTTEPPEERAQRYVERSVLLLREVQDQLKDAALKTMDADTTIWHVLATGGQTPEDDRITSSLPMAQEYTLSIEKGEALEKVWDALGWASRELYSTRTSFLQVVGDLEKFIGEESGADGEA